MPQKKKTTAKVTQKKRVKGSNKKLGTCMVLMPFKEPFDTYFQSIIKPAIHSAQLESVRGDSLFRPSPIMADVWQMIQNCKVLVADLTEKNATFFTNLG